MKLEIETYYALKDYIKPDKYLNCLKMIQAAALQSIRKKRRIKLAFQVDCLAEWVGDKIVRLFKANGRFDVTVVLTWRTDTEKEYELGLLKAHFERAGIRYVIADGTVQPGDFDIIIYTSPFLYAFEHFYDRDIPLSTLACYIPYGLFVAKIQWMQFNLVLHNILWKNYVGSKGYQILAEKYCDIGDYGMVYSGYPKMDRLYEPDARTKFKWKTAGRNNQVKRIIYAPHHSINELPWQSTFPENFEYVLEYARSHQETTSWVFKPHPALKLSCIKNGIFKDESGFDEYCAQWDSLPNGRYVYGDAGDYLPVFTSSDAMILDSASFMAEYLYTGKPALFLSRDGVTFNEVGEFVYDCLYQVKGNDFEGIRKFIEEVTDSDPRKAERENVFRQLFDYMRDNGISAAEYIYRDICRAIEE